jgi:hypothetical protein
VKEQLCRRCGVEMTPREARKGSGYCFICAPVHGPGEHRSFNEAIEETE